MKLKRTTLSTLALLIWATGTLADTITVPTDQPTIEAALVTALPGDTVFILDGTYNPPATLTVDQSVTVSGETEAGVIINIPEAGVYGISVTASDVILENFTLVANAANPNFPIQATGVDNAPTGNDNLTIQNVTISGVHQSTGLDVHGYNVVVLSNLSSSDATDGNGVQVTGCIDVTMDNITTANNGWGSIAIYSSSVLTRGSDNVAIDGTTLSLGEQAIFNQDDFGLFNTNIVVTGYNYLVRNVAAVGYTLYQDTEANAISAALLIPGSHIIDVSDGSLLVADGLSIQVAIDAAIADDTINVLAGIYREQLSIDKNLILSGAGLDVVTVEAPDAVDRTSYTVTSWNGSTKVADPIIGVTGPADVTITGLALDGRETGPADFHGLFFYNASGSVTFCSVNNIADPANLVSDNVANMVFTSDGTGTLALNISNNNMANFQKSGILVMGPDISFAIENNNITSVFSDVIAGNGLELSYGATGYTTNNVITGVGFTGDDWSGTGILLFECGDVSMSGDSVNNSQNGVSYNNWGGWGWLAPGVVTIEMDSVVLTDNTWSFYTQLSGDNSDLDLVATNCTITGTTGDAFEVYGTNAGDNWTGWENGDLNVSISGLTMNDTGVDGIWTANNPDAVTNTVHNFVVSGSSFSNTIGGAIANTFDETIIAEQNFWDDLSGPIVGAKASGNAKQASMSQPSGFKPVERGGHRLDVKSSASKAAETVIGPVDYSPWCGLAVGTSPMTWGTDDSIQDAIDLALASDTIMAKAGNYVEQVWVDKNDLTITGAGAGITVVESPVTTLPNFYTNDTNDTYPVFGFTGSTGCEVSELSIDGGNNAANNHIFAGFGLWNSGAWIHHVNVTGITHNPFNGQQGGHGFDVANDTSGPYTITVNDCTIDDIQKTGMALRGTGLTVDLDDITILGQGVTTVIAQNGLQLSPGVTGTVDNVDISGFAFFPGVDLVGAGVLMYGPGPYTLNNVNVLNCEWGIYSMDFNGSITGGSVINPVETELGLGVGLMIDWFDSAKSGQSHDNKVNMASARPQPDFEYIANPEKLDVTIAVDGVSFASNFPAFESQAIVSWSNGTNNITIDNCDVSGWTHGGILWDNDDSGTGDIVSTWRNNSLVADGGYALYGGGPNVQDAQQNWWGDATGPQHSVLNPAGLGSVVSDFVLFEPWTGLSFVTVTPATSGPLVCGQEVLLTFSLTVDDATPDVFGFNATVRATSEIDWGTITSLEAFGSTTQFMTFDNGDGSYLIAGTTLANPTQPIIAAGTYDLFTVVFTTAGDGIAGIAFDEFSLRDPSNQPITASAAGATIEVDCVAPTAVADLTADPHHNKVSVSWSHDGLDIDHYEIYRGLWYDTDVGISAYPEYNDLAGAIIPTRPSDRAVAGTSTEWELAGTVPAGTLAFDDLGEFTADRGVYYYEVFAVDTALPLGNNPLAADANVWATNYWLGDVPPFISGTVTPLDMSTLGDAFGESEGDDNYNPIVDVGPTDDASSFGVPTTDNEINFEDLMVFSLNFGLVSPTNKSDVVISSQANLSWIRYGEGNYGLRLIDATGLKGVHLRATLPEGASVTVTGGNLLDQQNEMTFLRNIGDNLDVNLAVMGVDNGFIGQGDLFLIESTVELVIDDIAIELRGSDNSNIEVNLDTESGVLTPRVFSLNAAYPNPFNPMTKISFSLPEAQAVRLNVYGLDGKLVATLVNEKRTAGLHEVIWNGQDDSGHLQASGLYFYRIEAGPHSQVRKMTLMK